MKTRVIIFSLVLCCFLSATAAVGENQRWRMMRSPNFGFSYQVPLNAVRQPTAPADSNSACDVFTSPNLAYMVEVSPTPANALASTTIEQLIQSDLKKAAKLGGKPSRWETTSSQGTLFKGYTGAIELSRTNPAHAAVMKALGGSNRGVQSVVLSAVGDESAPVLRITVVGPRAREAEVTSMAKEMASFVAIDPQPSAQAPSPEPAPAPEPGPAPAKEAKPWPELKSGQIELAGKVDTIAKDGKAIVVTVDTVKVINQDPITLSPARSKKVLLKTKLTWLMKGQYVHLIGKNSGEGKPIQAEAIEQAPSPAPAPKTGPPGPTPVP